MVIAGCGGDQVLRDLLLAAADGGWFDCSASRVVIEARGAEQNPAAARTARTLAAFLSESGRFESVYIAGLPSATGPPSTIGVDTRASQLIRVAAPLSVDGLLIPRDWFEHDYVVAVDACRRSAWGEISGSLNAQAESLRRLGNRLDCDSLVYEGHRLASPDVAIVCGHTTPDQVPSHQWWAIGTSDVAVELALADAAGVEPRTLSSIKALSRHGLLPDHVALIGELPFLGEYHAPTWRRFVKPVYTAVTRFWAALRRDVSRSRRNLHKIPRAVSRRLLP